MKDPVYNFGAGPAMLPPPVMEKIQANFLDFQGMGVSIIEISHRSKEFDAVIDRCDELFREIAGLPDNYRILYTHGGAQMQFAGVPLNLIGLKPALKAAYTETGNFSRLANLEAKRYGTIDIVSSGADRQYCEIPAFSRDMISDDTSYAFLTSNNTIYGTRYHSYPDMGDIPLVVDATSDILSCPIDWSRVDVMFAGLQKNLGPSGTAVTVVRDDLIGHALPQCPALMDWSVYDKAHSMPNTINTFAIYTMMLVLEWLKGQGGVAAMEGLNREKAGMLYQAIDESSFYSGTAHPDHRSLMNVTFTLPDDELTPVFVKEAEAEGLYALKGHRVVGGIRASIYNAMPVAGCRKLVEFMKEFERTRG